MGFFIPKDLYGIIGWPLGQTLSPLIQNIGFQKLGIDAAYMAWPIEAAALKEFVAALRMLRIRGLSVTIPHKIAIMSMLDNISEAAALAGAVNTLFWRENELCGENTDVAGFMSPLAKLPLEHMDILLLGAGGAAHAAASALRLAGCHKVRVTSAGNVRQYPLAERFAFTPIKWQERYARPTTLVINATPVGMRGKMEDQSPYDFTSAPEAVNGYAYDLIYNPVDTVFLQEAARAGRRCISGVAMFFAQGNEQFRIWTGKTLPDEAKQALIEALGVKE